MTRSCGNGLCGDCPQCKEEWAAPPCGHDDGRCDVDYCDRDPTGRETYVVHVRANRGVWSCRWEGEEWTQTHLGDFGAALTRRYLGLHRATPIEFRLV